MDRDRTAVQLCSSTAMELQLHKFPGACVDLAGKRCRYALTCIRFKLLMSIYRAEAAPVAAPSSAAAPASTYPMFLTPAALSAQPYVELQIVC